MQRRVFTAALAAAIAVPGTSPAAAQSDPEGAHVPGGLPQHMLAALSAEIGDKGTARSLVPHLHDVGFVWHPETIALRKLDFVVAYGFGNRPRPEAETPRRCAPNPARSTKTWPTPSPASADTATSPCTHSGK